MEHTQQQQQQRRQIILDYPQQRIMELQADGYHQQRQRLENESIRICRTDQRQLQCQIIRVQGLQILRHFNLLGNENHPSVFCHRWNTQNSRSSNGDK